MIETMAAMAERVVTESIDDLVREAEALKTRLEEERAKFNDMECKCALHHLRKTNFIGLF